MPDAVDGVMPGAGARPGMVVAPAAVGPTPGVIAGAIPFGIVPAGAMVGMGAPGAIAAGAVGASAGVPPGGGADGVVWPNEVSAKVMEQSEAVSSVFIG